ncbi:MAG: sugar phosphate isomerase/epimerase [Planctomycetota bacterium]|nr:sugar phosphate isomerase/epimerase [Planctomycetota bacterium]
MDSHPNARNASCAVCSWSLRPDGPRALAQTLAGLGIRRVQLALLPFFDRPAAWSDAFRILSENGIRVVSGMMQTVGEDYSTLASIARTGGMRSDETWPASLDRAFRTADLAAEHGVTLVTFHAGFIPHDKGHERDIILARLRTVTDLFVARGISIAFETGQESVETLWGALEELDRPAIGINFDPANMILYGMGEPVAALRTLLPRVVQLHIKDAIPATTAGEWGREVPVGSGSVDWASFFAVVRQSPLPLEMVIEREAGTCREADIVAARDLITRNMN